LVLVALVPLGVVTVTSTVLEPVGAVAVIVVGLFTVNAAELPGPKSTAVAPVKSVPLTSTVVPAGPVTGLTDVTVGAGGGPAMYVNWSFVPVALVPPAVVTVTSTVPAEPPGEVAVMDESPLTVKPAEVAPKCSALAAVKPVPLTATVVPPAVGPEVGLTAVTVGAGGGVPPTVTVTEEDSGPCPDPL
jgi:uncharacterized membrane protein YfcA